MLAINFLCSRVGEKLLHRFFLTLYNTAVVVCCFHKFWFITRKITLIYIHSCCRLCNNNKYCEMYVSPKGFRALPRRVVNFGFLGEIDDRHEESSRLYKIFTIALKHIEESPCKLLT